MLLTILYFIATHKVILLNLLLLNWIRHRKTATIAINKTVPPTVMPMVVPVEFDSSAAEFDLSDMLISVIRKWYDSNASKYKVLYLLRQLS